MAPESSTKATPWPMMAMYESTTFTAGTIIIYSRGPTYRNEPLRGDWDEPLRKFEEEVSRYEARRILSRKRTALAIRAAKLDGCPPLAARQYVRPKRSGRAVGSRHMVML